jgi:hypothetical protein
MRWNNAAISFGSSTCSACPTDQHAPAGGHPVVELVCLKRDRAVAVPSSYDAVEIRYG